MLNILFKIGEMDHLTRTGNCNIGGGKRDSFIFTLLKYILYDRIYSSNLGHLQQFGDAFVSCVFPKHDNTCYPESFKTTFLSYVHCYL